MRIALLLALVASLVHAAPSDTFPCSASGVYSVLGQQGIFGCNGYSNSITVLWNVNDTSSRALTFLSMNTEACCDKVTITYGSIVYGPFSGTALPGTYLFGGGNIMVSFKTDASGTAPGFSIQLSPAPVLDTLVSQQPYRTTLTAGGFTYFQLNNAISGSLLTFDMAVSQYDGLQSPSIFLSNSGLPSLESYQYMNTSVATGSGAVSSLTIRNPATANYYLGVFLYGNSATLTLLANWQFNFAPLINGNKLTSSVSTTNNYQLYTPRLTKKLNFQISRQVPGGYPIAYIAQGYVPSASQYDWVMDTTVQSYINLDINNPNPTVNYNPNPGNYILTLVASAGLDSDVAAQKPVVLELPKPKEGEQSVELVSAGFILMATWA